MSARRLTAAAFVLPLILAIALMAVPTSDAKKRGPGKRVVVPKTGIYSAEPAKPEGDFLLGTFAVVHDQDGTRIVSVETQTGIYVPSLFECTPQTLPLRKEVVPVKRNGRFKVRDVRPTPEGKQVVRWTGKWVRPGKVRGKIRVKVKRCKSKYAWKARRLPPGVE